MRAEPEVVSVGSQRQIDKSKWKYLSSGWGSCDNTHPCLPPMQLIFSTNGIQGYSNKSLGFYQLIWELIFFFFFRGCGWAMCVVAGIQLSGAAGFTCHGHLWGQGGLPCGQPEWPPPGLAAGKPDHPQQRGDHREQPGFTDCYTKLQLHQYLPGLPRPGLALVGGRRGAHQSRMYVRHLFDSRLMFVQCRLSTGDHRLTYLTQLTLTYQ